MSSTINLSRTDDDEFVLEREQPPFSTVTVYAGKDPEAIDRSRPVAQGKNTDRLIIGNLPANVRHYFEVIEDGKPPVYIAERRLPLLGAANFRDLGGYFTQDERQVKWGRIFRADALDRLEPDDLALLKQIDVALVCDLRSQEEVQERPTMLRVHNHVHLPIKDPLIDSSTIRRKLISGSTDGLDEALMVSSYQRLLDQYGQHFGNVLRYLADPQHLPAVFHCTGGKDRTGITAALLLSALGVPRETIVADYDLTNVYTAHIVERIMVQLQAHGVDTRNLKAIFSAPLILINTGLDYIDTQYGGPLRYLELQAGIGPDVIHALRAALLYPVLGSTSA